MLFSKIQAFCIFRLPPTNIYALFGHITQRTVIIPYRRFGTTHHQGPLKMEPIGCIETSVSSFHCTQFNISEQSRFHLKAICFVELHVAHTYPQFVGKFQWLKYGYDVIFTVSACPFTLCSYFGPKLCIAIVIKVTWLWAAAEETQTISHNLIFIRYIANYVFGS